MRLYLFILLILLLIILYYMYIWANKVKNEPDARKSLYGNRYPINENGF